MKRMILVDGNSLMYRAYYGMAAGGGLTQNSKGLFTNAIYGFARMINHLINSEYDAILVAFDAGKKTVRYMHSVFHIFVVIGSALQFLAVWMYAL